MRDEGEKATRSLPLSFLDKGVRGQLLWCACGCDQSVCRELACFSCSSRGTDRSREHEDAHEI